MTFRLVVALGLGFLVVSPATPRLAAQAGRETARLEVTLPLPGDQSVFLQRPVGATRFMDGTVLIADGMAQTVHVFGPGGEYVRSAGRPGEGPNEFSTPGWMGRCGPGTATVWDFSLMRYTVIDSTGAISDQLRMEEVTDVPRPPARVKCNRNGNMAALLRLMGDRIEGRVISVLTAPLHLSRPGGESVVLDEDAPVIEWVNEDRIYRPVSPTTHFALTDSSVFIARSDSAVVHVLDLDGRPRATWSVEVRPRTPTDAHVRRDAEILTAFIGDPAAREEIVQRYLGMDRPEQLPFFSAMLADPDGRIWLVESAPGDEETLLSCYGTDGVGSARVAIPLGLEVWEVGREHVLGTRIHPDTLEPQVLVYRFSSDCSP